LFLSIVVIKAFSVEYIWNVEAIVSLDVPITRLCYFPQDIENTLRLSNEKIIIGSSRSSL